MNINKKLLLFSSFLLVFLFFRDVPYLNIFFITKIWIAYILLFIFLFPPRKSEHLFYVLIGIILLALIFTMLRFFVITEMQGIVIYFTLFTIVILRILSLIKKQP